MWVSWQFAVSGWDTPRGGCSTRYKPCQLWCESLCMLSCQDYTLLLVYPLVMMTQWRAVKIQASWKALVYIILYMNLLFSCILAKLYHLEFQYPKNWHHLELAESWAHHVYFEHYPTISRPASEGSTSGSRCSLQPCGLARLRLSILNGENDDKPQGFGVPCFLHKPTYNHRL